MEILLYAANMLNYLRFLMIIIMMLNFKNRPILAFIIGITAGFIDDLDGPVARHLNETSRFGAALDRSLDRLTTTFLYFYLTSHFSKYWLFFFNIAFIELLSDVLRFFVESYANFLKISKMV
jgi:phosphatidylglycerophosphate synthase